MLRGINPILTGELLHVLSDMGHGDTIVIATNDPTRYACFILAKGALPEPRES